MTEITTYNQSGKSVDTSDAESAIFSEPTNRDLLYRVVNAAQFNARQPVAHTKERDERRGGGKKPWRQKGTGRARHGSIRSPLWKGGGVTFGPRNEKNFKKKVNKKERKKAICSALSAKNRDGEVLFVDELSFDEPSAKSARAFLDNLGGNEDISAVATRNKNSALIITPEFAENTHLSFRNFQNIAVQSADRVNTMDLLRYKYTIIVDADTTIEKLEDRLLMKATN